MIEIRITDPASTPPAELKNVIRFLSSYLGEEYGPTSEVTIRMDASGLLKHAQQVASEDNPSAGLDTAAILAGKPGVVAPSIAAVVLSPTVPGVPTDTSTSQTGQVPNAASPALSAVPAVPGTANPAPRDSAGMPWDGRIHAETKTTVADGTWRKKRGVDTNLVAAVEAELRQAMDAPAAPVIPVVPNVPAVPTAPTLPVVSPAVSDGQNAIIAASAAPLQMTFPILMGKITAAMSPANPVPLTDAKIAEVLSSLGLPTTLPSLVTRADMIPTVALMLFGSPNP